ncbi:MAG TPA: glycosyltransferase family 9 protein [Bryobacteraceae bacterium]|nr:glycosyltransferase family 9 protein [Bryobacteraceae bacterium]
MSTLRILVVRLSSMGDVIHALPAAATLKQSFPGCRLSWLIRPRWAPLLEGNPFVDEVIPLDRSLGAALHSIPLLRRARFDLAVDFQGLIQSAVIAAAAGARKLVGFGTGAVREKPAAFFYSATVEPNAAHVVDRNLELAAAVGASQAVRDFPLPQGHPEGSLPGREFVLASPFAGWRSKQWPLEFWSELAARVDLPIVLNGPLSAARELSEIAGVFLHASGIPGLIDATRKATAVIGVDSGPLHVAAALGKPGIALYGPTDPARNGPYGGSIRVLRAEGAVTDYHRREEPDPSMRALTPEIAAQALTEVLEKAAREDHRG